VRQVETLADLPVRESRARESRDLELLGGECFVRGRHGAEVAFAGRAQLGAGQIGPTAGADELEGGAGRAQWRA